MTEFVLAAIIVIMVNPTVFRSKLQLEKFLFLFVISVTSMTIVSVVSVS